jgi:hypothetical protein
MPSSMFFAKNRELLAGQPESAAADYEGLRRMLNWRRVQLGMTMSDVDYLA